MRLKKLYSRCLVFPLLLFFHAAWTQSSISVGPSISSGTKSFPPNGRIGFGGSVEYTTYLLKNGSLRLYAGYDHFAHNFPKLDPRVLQDSIRVIGIYGYDISLIPIRVGYQQCLYKDAAFVYAEAGISHLLTKYKDWSTFNSNNLFTFALGTGFKFTFQQSHVIQLSIFYNYNRLDAYRNLNYMSLSVAYGLPFGK